MASHYTPVHHPNCTRHSQYGSHSPHDRIFYPPISPHLARPRAYPSTSAPPASMAYYYRQSLSSPNIAATYPPLVTAPVLNSPRLREISNDPSSLSSLPAILPRYRGKHARAASTGSIPKPGPILAEKASQLMKIEASLPPTEPITETSHEPIKSSPSLYYSASQAYAQSHRRAHSSMSSSNASVDTNSTQTSLSSSGSVHSVEELAIKPNARKPATQTTPTKLQPIKSVNQPPPAEPTDQSPLTMQLIDQSTAIESTKPQTTKPASTKPATTKPASTKPTKSQPTKSAQSLVLPSDARRRSSPALDAPSYPIDTRPANAPEFRRSISEPGKVNRVSPNTRGNRLIKPEVPQSSARLQRALSSQPPQPAKTDPPPLRKSRSFSAKLRGLFGAKSSAPNDDAVSIKSAKSSLSIRSSSSMRSLRSAFGRKKAEPVAKPDIRLELGSCEPPLVTAPSSPQSPNSPPPNSPHPDSPPPNSPHPDSPTQSPKDEPISSQPHPVMEIPRPPSPALRSLVRPNDSPTAEHTPPANLSAGDIFPGELKPANVETIVNSVQRTGSFKRQPSTTKPTKEEVIPDAEEVEVDSTSVAPAILSSALKQGRSRKKRSGAASNLLKVEFAHQILVYKTYSAQGYDRTPDRMTCDQLSEPGMAQKLREELNHWKALMPVHPESVGNTQFFHT